MTDTDRPKRVSRSPVRPVCPHFLTVLFGPIGDALMTAALFDDILQLLPAAQFLVLARHNTELIADVMRAYPSVRVEKIPDGFSAVPFFVRLFARRWTFLALGVAGAYSFRLKLFFLLLSLRPGNYTLGFNDRESGERSRLPIQRVFLFDPTHSTIDNFRRLLPPLFGKEARAINRAPHVVLNLQRPQNWTLAPGTYIAVHLFGSRVIRRLPPRRAKHLLNELKRRYPGYTLVLTGSRDDRAAAEDIATDAPGLTVLLGLPILEVGWVVENAALYIGVDTGITHLAGVLRQKSIILSHSADPMWMPLYNPNARMLLNSTRCACDTGNCIIEEEGIAYRRCMYDITDEAILSSIDLGLSSPERAVPGFAGLIDESRMSH